MSLVPDRLRARVNAAKLAPAEVDARAGLAGGTTACLLGGDRQARGDEVARLAIALDCSVPDLSDGAMHTEEYRAYITAAVALTPDDAVLVLAAAYGAVGRRAQTELRRVVHAVVRRRNG